MMTTLDHYAIRRKPRRLDIHSVGPTIAALLLLAFGATALTAPPAAVADDWHGNVAVSAPR